MAEGKNKWVCGSHGVFTSAAREAWTCPLCGKPGKHYGDEVAPQTTRMLKCVCGKCGYTARTTRKWIDLKGAPLCPCAGEAMDVSLGASPEDEAIGGGD